MKTTNTFTPSPRAPFRLLFVHFGRYLLMLCALGLNFAATARAEEQSQNDSSPADSVLAAPGPISEAAIPPALLPWREWVLWGEPTRNIPTPYNDASRLVPFWPAALNVTAGAQGATFDLTVNVFHECRVPLPGGAELWPQEVKDNGTPLPVTLHENAPSVKLAPGVHQLQGVFRWAEMPQRIPLPREIGVLALTLNDKPVPAPAWDAEGSLWLRRDTSTAEQTDKDYLSVKLHARLEDGIPMWMRLEMEVIVSGKSREEEIGQILPEGWRLATLDAAIPFAVDASGKAKAQVRAGKWTVRASAFRFDNPKEIRFPEKASLAVDEMFVAFQSRPDFRTIDILDIPSVDVSQASFPDAWRELPVYRWETARPFRIEERMRGAGQQKPEGIRIQREMWLDESGDGFTYRDKISGNMQQIWRLDSAYELGSVRSGDKGQLITRNPANNAPGVEIRQRNLELEATGRITQMASMPATGWLADADDLNVTLNLPPGWRLFALFGADKVSGDWLTSWTLLDIFLLMVFAMAVFRLFGVGAGVLALAAYALAYHEPGSPSYVWLALLIPLALLRVVKKGWGHRFLLACKYFVIFLLVLALVPFVAREVQQAIYPQLETLRGNVLGFEQSSQVIVYHDFESVTAMPAPSPEPSGNMEENMPQQQSNAAPSFSAPSSRWDMSKEKAKKQASNLAYDTKARIQTGPGVPDWEWRKVSFSWNGPVQADQSVRMFLVPIGLQRVLTVLRVALLLALAWVLLRPTPGESDGSDRSGSSENPPKSPAPAPAAALLLSVLFLCGAGSLRAQPAPGAAFPDAALLDELRERLLQPSDAFPNAAEIASATLRLGEKRTLSMTLEVHAAAPAAVPVPGRLPSWSPLSVTVDGQPASAVRRMDESLWVVVPAGVHRVEVQGMLPDVTEWEWAFTLKPRHVTLDAPDWTVSGLRPDGVPEAQIFFAQKKKAGNAEATYDHQELVPLVSVNRALELGLVWSSETTVRRLSPVGKAVSLRIPLLPGENVLTSNAVVKDGFIEVRLGAQDETFAWESELSPAERVAFATRPADTWVESWQLIASPVWNVAFSGLAPTFEAGNQQLVPVWHPWPGESMEVAVTRPEAVAGATTTVNSARLDVELGLRQRVTKMSLSLVCSLGEDFPVQLPPGADVTSLKHNDRDIPVRREGDKVIVPLRPGQQKLDMEWKTSAPLGVVAPVDAVTLPVPAVNVNLEMSVPESRWILWTHGPLRGPAVRFWPLLVCVVLAAWRLSTLRLSPLKTWQWILLGLGLTQVPLVASLAVIAWFLLLSWRGGEGSQKLNAPTHALLQMLLAGLTVAVLVIFIAVVASGLLGDPKMFIAGNGSYENSLRWYQDISANALPTPACFSVSIWFYRAFMLAWALWLAVSLIGWLIWGWTQFSKGGVFPSAPKPEKPAAPTPPPLPQA